MRARTIAASAALLLGACASSFSEVHYFRSKPTSEAEIPNYFRLRVTGTATLSSSRYVSGYFDEATLNAYFNEFTQPQGGALQRTAPAGGASVLPVLATSGQAAAGPGAREVVEPMAGALEGKQLVLVLSSNSDEVVNQIGALAQANQFAANLVALASRGDVASADEAERRLAVDLAHARASARLAQGLMTQLPAGSTAVAAEAQLLALVNALAGDLGAERSFKSLKEFATWWEANRARMGGAR